MKTINKILIYLLCNHICIVNVHSFDDIEMNETLIVTDDNNRDRQGDTATIDESFDKIEDESLLRTTDIPMILQSTAPTVEIINQSTVEQTLQLSMTNSSIAPVHTLATTMFPSTDFSSCNSPTEIQINGVCMSRDDVRTMAVNTITRNNSVRSIEVANALSVYIDVTTDLITTFDSSYALTLDEIDTHLKSINKVTLALNTKTSFIMAKQQNQDKNVSSSGAAFTHDVGGVVINNVNKDNVLSSNFSAAAIISPDSLVDVTSLNMLIIDKPSPYRNIDNSSNKILASSIIMASVQRSKPISTFMNISLYFQVLPAYKPNVSGIYLCSFYDPNTLKWNESGCTPPTYNEQFNRYECSCNHLTTFALIWLPESLPAYTSLHTQDIASLAFQSAAIISFLAVIIHAIIKRLRDPSMGLRIYDLIPLISSASATILFIFYIALGMTVYTKTSSENETKCFLSSSILMFFFYFFLILTFCIKTSVGYFNYLRFVHLPSQPPFKKLYILLLISFIISITWVSFASGFNSNSSFSITQLYPYKLCWFTHNILYYFLTIPAGLFLLINIIIAIIVIIHIINRTRNDTSSYQSYVRMKRCALILLLSCLPQGIGWLFGPFITFFNSTGIDVFGWFFIVFNGLETVWPILLYIISGSFICCTDDL